MKVAQVPKAGADFRIVEREIPKPGAGQVLIKVQACGVCHSVNGFLARRVTEAKSGGDSSRRYVSLFES
jgi:Zn-dependent alcohol dehydrogenase